MTFFADTAVQRRDKHDVVPCLGLSSSQRTRGVRQTARLGIREHLTAGVEDVHEKSRLLSWRGCDRCAGSFAVVQG